MKICFALHGFPPELSGGTERTVLALGQAMQAAGHEVLVVAGALGTGDPYQPREDQVAGLRVLRLSRDDQHFEDWFKVYHPGLSRSFAQLLAREQPEVLHVHHWLRLSADLCRQARIQGIRCVATLHDFFSVTAAATRMARSEGVAAPPGAAWQIRREVEEEFAQFRRDMQAELGAAQLLLAPSAAHAAALRQLAAGELPHLRVQHPPLLDLPAPGPGTRPGGRQLLTWGSLYPGKGLEVLLEALRQCAEPWQLKIYGEAHDPAYLDQLQSRAAGLAVEFCGAFSPGELSTVEADLAVFASECAESYGLVLDEAQALGLPLVCSDLPAFVEHLPAGAGRSFAVGDPLALAEVLEDLEGLAALRAPEAVAGHDPAAVAGELLEMYAEIGAPTEFREDPDLAARRAELLMRRAERRLWGFADGRPLPPEDFLA